MSQISTKGYIVRHIQDAPTVECLCGPSTRPLTRGDTDVCNLHITRIKDSAKHYHKECTEVYYILEGKGEMELNEDVVTLEPGVVVYIEPGTVHKVTGDIRTIVFGVPALNPEDEFLVE